MIFLCLYGVIGDKSEHNPNVKKRLGKHWEGSTNSLSLEFLENRLH